MAKGIINNTSSIQITGIHALPFILPNENTKIQVEKLVNEIIKNKMKNLNYNFIREQEQIDKHIFKLYSERFNLSERLKKRLDREFSVYKDL